MGKKKDEPNIVNREIWVVQGPVYNGNEIWANICEHINIRANIKNKRNTVLKRIARRIEKKHGFTEQALWFNECKVYRKKRYKPTQHISDPETPSFDFKD